MTRVYCSDSECDNNTKLDVPVEIKPTKFYVPVGTEKNLCNGECKSKSLTLIPTRIEGNNIDYSVIECIPVKVKKNEELGFICKGTSCSHNKDSECLKESIFVDKLIVDNILYFVCKNYSTIKRTGHKDWSSNLNSDGHPKYGGHLSDADSDKMYYDNLKFKSYPKGDHRDSKEPKRKK